MFAHHYHHIVLHYQAIFVVLLANLAFIDEVVQHGSAVYVQSKDVHYR